MIRSQNDSPPPKSRVCRTDYQIQSCNLCRVARHVGNRHDLYGYWKLIDSPTVFPEMLPSPEIEMSAYSYYFIVAGADCYNIIEPKLLGVSPSVKLSSIFTADTKYRGYVPILCMTFSLSLFSPFIWTRYSFSLDIADRATYLLSSCFLLSPEPILWSRRVRLMRLRTPTVLSCG